MLKNSSLNWVVKKIFELVKLVFSAQPSERKTYGSLKKKPKNCLCVFLDKDMCDFSTLRVLFQVIFSRALQCFFLSFTNSDALI